MKASKTELFEKTPVTRAVLALVVPTVISQIITVIYNMADTFFVGQVGDPNQVAAASLSLPLFLVTTGLANLFGIGGASLISRSLGLGLFTVSRYLRCAVLFCPPSAQMNSHMIFARAISSGRSLSALFRRF